MKTVHDALSKMMHQFSISPTIFQISYHEKIHTKLLVFIISDSTEKD